jgi:hypothetical protein
MSSKVFIQFLGCCRYELEELELEKRQYYLLNIIPSEEEAYALT